MRCFYLHVHPTIDMLDLETSPSILLGQGLRFQLYFSCQTEMPSFMLSGDFSLCGLLRMVLVINCTLVGGF